MRVLQVITSLQTGGAEKLIVDSVPIYQGRNIKMDILSLNNNKSAFWEKLIQNSNGEITGLTSKSVYNPFLIFKIIPYFKKYDIVHLHLFPTLYWVVIAKWVSFSKVKLVYTEHSTSNRRRDKFVFKILDRFFYSKLDEVVCITEGVKNNLIRHLGNKKNIKVINNGIDVKKFDGATIENKNFNFFAKDDFILIQVASFRMQKDHATLIRSLTLLPEKVKLLLVGEGILIGENKRLVIELDLQDRVTFLGNRYDIPELINYCDVVILSSEWEGFGLAIVEGMAANKPVIASDIDGVREIVNGYGLLFEKGNKKELALQINRIIEDNGLYQKIADKCLLRSKDFDISKMIDSYIKIYSGLLKE